MRTIRRRKLPATTLLLALWNKGVEQKLAKGGELSDEDRRFSGMSAEEILNYFYTQVVFSKSKKGWTAPFEPERMKGMKLNADLVDAKSGKVVAEIGAKMTPRLGKKLQEAGLKEILVQPEELHGRYAALDIVNG